MKPGDLVMINSKGYIGAGQGETGLMIRPNARYGSPHFIYWDVMFPSGIFAMAENVLEVLNETG